MKTRAMKWRNVLVTCLGLGGIVASVACNPDVKVGDEAGGAGSTASAGSTTSGSAGGGAPVNAACAAPAGEVHPLGSAKEFYDAESRGIGRFAMAWPPGRRRRRTR